MRRWINTTVVSQHHIDEHHMDLHSTKWHNLLARFETTYVKYDGKTLNIKSYFRGKIVG